MHQPICRAALALATLLLAGTARAADPASVPPAPAPRSDAPVPAARPSQAEVQASLNAIGTADTRRLLTDRVYAGEMLAHLDRIAPYMSAEPGAVTAVRNLRLLALATLGRRADGAPIIDQIIESRPAEASQYAGPWIATLIFEDRARAVSLVETASRAVPGVRWSDLRSLFDRQTVWALLVQLKNDGQNADRVRLAEALFRIGWPGGGDVESGDYLRSILLNDRLAAGDGAAARGYADGIQTLSSTVPLLLGKRYDIALPAGTDRLALLRTAIARQDEATREALAATPGDMQRLVERANYLRSVARNEEAVALLRPHLTDVPALAANGEHGMWVVNEAAIALASLGRNDEALALMDRIAALPVAGNPSLIGLRINHLGLLWEAGRYEETLRRADALEADAARFANDYGKAGIAAIRVCALASLGRSGEAAPLVARLRGWGAVNPVALTDAYICLGDDDAASAQLVHRLEDPDPDQTIQSLQDYSLAVEARGPIIPLRQRFQALRERPEVRAAFDRVARRMTLPLSRRFWGEY